MRYDEMLRALAEQPGKAIATREGAATLHVMRKFGYYVMLRQGRRFIAYTPTRDDIYADDWRILTETEREARLKPPRT